MSVHPHVSNGVSWSVLTATLLGLLASAAIGQTATPAASAARRVKLWKVTPGVVPGRDTDTDPTVPTMDIYLPPASRATGTGIVVLPGGGYTHLSTIREGSDVAHMLVNNGIAAFVVRYRHAPRYHYPAPFLDAQRAMRTVRAEAADFHISPHRIGIMGFSAGGHLAATVATQFHDGDADAADPIEHVSSRPDFVVLLYPVITLVDEPYVHKGSRMALVGNRRDLWTKLSADLHVTPQTPPVFIAQASTDTTVPVQNSVLFYLACRKNRVPVEMHLFEKGSHGFGLAPGNPSLDVWPKLMLTWMRINHWLPAPAAN